MEVGIIFKIGAVGILVSVLSLVLKHSGREDQAFLTSLAGLVLVLFWVLPYIYDLFETEKNYLPCRQAGRMAIWKLSGSVRRVSPVYWLRSL